MKYAAIAAAVAVADARMWFGACPAVNWDTDLDHARFAGQWYETKRDNLATMDMGQTCSTSTYALRGDGHLDCQYRAFIPMNWMSYSQSPVMHMDCSGSNKCSWDVEGYSKDDGWDENFELGILATDYDNWHVLYGCGQTPFGNMQWFTIQNITSTMKLFQLGVPFGQTLSSKVCQPHSLFIAYRQSLMRKILATSSAPPAPKKYNNPI